MSSAQENMSRRKQSRPKAIKRPDHPQLSPPPSLPPPLTLVRHHRQDEELDRPSVVCTTRLEAGTKFGPYDVSLITDDADSDSDCVVKISSADHDQSFIIKSQDGDWLSLIRLQTQSDNSIMTLQDSKIWLEISATLEPETEIVATTCSIKSETAEETDAAVVKVEPEVDENKPEVDTAPSTGEIESRIYICPHCAVRFSSVGTLEAHVTHYCRKHEDAMSHVVMTTSEGRETEVEVDDDSHQPMKKRRRFSSVAMETMTTTTTAAVKVGKDEEEDPSKPFRCPHCSFVSAKRTNLHCHMRNMHRNPYKSQDGGDDEITMPELYCVECKIQFSATKTFTAHKTYYCGRRKSESDEYRSTPMSLTHINALTTLTPPLFVTPMLLANGTPMPILMQPVFVPMEEAKTDDVKSTQEQPLDLTIKKSPTTLDKNQNDIKKSLDSDQDKVGGDEQMDQIDGKQAYNICNSCKIVFYKYENFMIHKQYYCRGRHDEEQQENGENGDERCESPLTVTCGPCNITFKSQVTLEAHQQYYCPHRERKEAPSDEEGQSLYVCRKCGREYATPKLFRMHFCDKGKQASETWSLHRCGRCNFVTHKETAFVEHMRKHASINGYRCQMCGYKGNTVRGMRMHGKMMHPELGDNFMDAQVVELHKFPNDVPDQKVDPDLESEIIRLKSEPYKRRRSKYHRQAPPSGGRVTPPSGVVTPPDGGSVTPPGGGAVTPPSGEVVETVTFKCNVCEISFTGSSDQHVKEYHTKQRGSPREFRVSVKEELKEEEEELDPVTVDDELVPSPPARVQTPDPPHPSPKPTTSRVQLTIPKLEIKTEINSLLPTTVAMETDSSGAVKESGRHCDDCNITFKFSHSYSAHKKYYCSARSSSVASDVTFSPPLATVD